MSDQSLSLASRAFAPTSPDAGGLAPSARLRPMRWRPVVSVETLLLGFSLYFTAACNTPFWHALTSGRSSEGGLSYVLAVGTALTALHFVRKHPANPSCRFAQAQATGCQRCGSNSPILL